MKLLKKIFKNISVTQQVKVISGNNNKVVINGKDVSIKKKKEKRPCLGVIKCLLKKMELANMKDDNGYVIRHDINNGYYYCIGLGIEYWQVGSLVFKDEFSTIFLAKTLEVNHVSMEELSQIIKEVENEKTEL